MPTIADLPNELLVEVLTYDARDHINNNKRLPYHEIVSDCENYLDYLRSRKVNLKIFAAAKEAFWQVNVAVVYAMPPAENEPRKIVRFKGELGDDMIDKARHVKIVVGKFGGFDANTISLDGFRSDMEVFFGKIQDLRSARVELYFWVLGLHPWTPGNMEEALSALRDSLEKVRTITGERVDVGEMIFEEPLSIIR